MAAARRSLSTGGENPEFVMRDFMGMNNNPAREAINDDEFYWCENAIPLAAGNLSPVNVPSAALRTIASETTNPTYVMVFNGQGPPPFGRIPFQYIFAVFGASGNGYVLRGDNFATVATLTGLSTIGTYATQYSNQGILIIDPNGYWDFNIGTYQSFTSWNNTVNGATNTSKTSIASHTNLKQVVTTAAGVGGSFTVHYQVISATINAAGTGYVIGDSLSLADGGYVTPANIIVASVGAGGAITGITLAAGGDYNGPGTGAFVAVGPTGTASGGTGTGATFTCTIQSFKFVVNSVGRNYANTDTVIDETATPTTIDSWTLVTSGIIGGTGIATYAGRVWIAFKRTVFVSDINVYNSFGGAGTSFTINDAYLFNNITCLFATNNYLYIFGDGSVDAVSNVTVSATTGLTSFSRINVTTSVGTSAPASVFGYYRSLVFFHSSGVYLLAGATPEKISEKVSGIIRACTAATVTGACGGIVLVQGELCIALQVFITDTFTQNGTVRPIVLLYFRNRWWAHSFPFTVAGLNLASQNNIALNNMYAFGGAAGANPSIYSVFTGAALASWLLKTKLWDGGTALKEKQSLNTAIAGIMSGLGSSGVTFTVDTELGSSPATAYPVNGTPSGYQLLVKQSDQGAATGPAQYLGLTIAGDGTDMSNVHLLALRGKTERDFLQ